MAGNVGRTLRGALLAVAAVGAGAMPAPASAAPDIRDHLNIDQDGHCPEYGGVEICSGSVPSWDGTQLDVDVTLPRNDGGRARHPLMVMLHGLGANKHEWESTSDEADGRNKWHWNNRWFAHHGYYVLTFTARGFRNDGPYEDYQPATPGFTSADPPNGTLRLKSKEVEIRDTRWLAALVAAGFADLDRDRVAVSGGSYGGGESWTQASRPRWDEPHEQDSSLPVLTLQAAVPMRSWTDLMYALAPHGRGGGPSGADIYESSAGRPNSPDGSGFPIGTVKQSYVDGFYELANQQGVFESGGSTTPTTEGPINVHCWKSRGNGKPNLPPPCFPWGDPYEAAGVEDEIVRQFRRGLTEYRSSYYQDEGWQSQPPEDRAAILALHGWTDDIFPAIEVFRQFKYLKRLDPRWPVSVEVADIGHSRAQNKPEQHRRLNARAFQWLQSNIQGTHERTTVVASEPTICANDGERDNQDAKAQRLTATSPEGLSEGTLTVRYSSPGSSDSVLAAADPNGPATDAVVTDPLTATLPCVASAGPAVGGYTAYSDPLREASTYIGLGFVDVRYAFEAAPAPTATLHARVFDVPPNGGPELLMTRGTYRLIAPYDELVGSVRVPLYGNHWPLRPGHRIRLDLTLVDRPTYEPSNMKSSIQLAPPTLELPTRESGNRSVEGG